MKKKSSKKQNVKLNPIELTFYDKDGNLIYSCCEENTLAKIVEYAVKNQVSLWDALLWSANLCDTDFKGANTHNVLV